MVQNVIRDGPVHAICSLSGRTLFLQRKLILSFFYLSVLLAVFTHMEGTYAASVLLLTGSSVAWQRRWPA